MLRDGEEEGGKEEGRNAGVGWCGVMWGDEVREEKTEGGREGQNNHKQRPRRGRWKGGEITARDRSQRLKEGDRDFEWDREESHPAS